MASDVELEQVTKFFGDFKAVDGVSLYVAAGSFVALLGSSGAGKSTVLRMIGGFELPDDGSIRIGGRDVTALPPYRRDVNTVFQNYALFPHMTVAENVAYGLRRDGVPGAERRARVREALEMVQMLPLAHRRPSQLSGGQQQRVALARALVKRPSVLLLDEPLGALDRKLRQQMQVELKLLQHQLGTTFIFVTHDQEEALAMSDTIAVMRDGRIDQVGEPTELYDRPHTAFVASFIGAQNFFAGQIGQDQRLIADGFVIAAARLAEGAKPGERGLAGVRPEHVQLSAAEPAAPVNKVSGRVMALVMLGDMVEFVLRLPGGAELFSRLPRDAGVLPGQGQEVWAHWPVERVTLFPYEALAARESGLRRRAEQANGSA
ncbi:MAG: spermidine/putrescine transporter ATP-binding protein [Rhodospirillales bacterium]|nr:spermidine/putrescine transporter ATP-binding protein [Rhodospirillales bacterium]